MLIVYEVYDDVVKVNCESNWEAYILLAAKFKKLEIDRKC
jgi:hypothetical protein